MKCLCDDTSPFMLASIQVESGELFQEREVQKGLRPQWYIGLFHLISVQVYGRQYFIIPLK